MLVTAHEHMSIWTYISPCRGGGALCIDDGHAVIRLKKGWIFKKTFLQTFLKLNSQEIIKEITE